MKRTFGVSLLLAMAVIPGNLGAAERVVARGDDMDYGPFQCYTVGFPDVKDENLAIKGVAIQLGERREAAVCFDTDLMRYLAGWKGGFLDRSNTHLTTSKGTLHARIKGEVVFRSRSAPGWGVDGDLSDPRSVRPGPLPRAWAHYKGLYRHGRRVILSYDVAGCDVAELPAYETIGGMGMFTRAVEMGRSDRPLALRVCDALGGHGEAEPVGLDDPNRIAFGEDLLTIVGLIGAPPGARLERRPDGAILVSLPALQSLARFKVAIWQGAPAAVASASEAMDRLEEPPRLRELCGGGEPLWGEEVVTRGRRGFGTGPYVVDTLTLPEANPWNSWMRLLALDFFSNGRAAVSTWNGDVWVVSGIDDKLARLSWKRYAAGLFEGLGLKIVNDQIYVVERSQLTRLHDLDGDGEADFYENFNNDAPVGPSYHAFSFGLDTDSGGNFYFTRCGHRVDPGLPLNGGMIRVSKDGRRSEMWATGMRAPNGMSIGPGDAITCSDNQGNWVPSSRINWIERGGFYGYVPHARREETPTDYDKPICWLPMTEDNSSGGQVWVTTDRWGPFEGELLHTSYGKATLFHVMTERVEGQVQGGVMAFPLRFSSGIMRARFNPADGQLYVCGLGGGWQTSGVRDGALERVRYTGKPVYRPVGLHVRTDGIEIEFSEPLDAEMAGDDQNYAVEQWNYRWTEAYGSKDYSAADGTREGRDEVPVLSADLQADQRTVVLRLAEVRPVMQMRIQFRIRAADGGKVAGELFNTINRVSVDAGVR